MPHHLSSADIAIFQQKSASFVISRKTYIDCILIHIFMFSNFLTFESVKVIFRKMVSILMRSAKSAILGRLKIKVF